MAHGSETRKTRGGKTGVKGRRSREDAGLGRSLRLTGEEGEKRAGKLLKLWTNLGRSVQHEWFGSPKASSLINKGKDKSSPFPLPPDRSTRIPYFVPQEETVAAPKEQMGKKERVEEETIQQSRGFELPSEKFTRRIYRKG